MQKERIVKSREEWRKYNQVKKIRIFMTAVAVILCISVAAGAVLAWFQVKRTVEHAQQRPASSAAPVSSEEESLPVYDDSFNLMLVNSSHPLAGGYAPVLAEYEGVQVDGRIVQALTKMMQDAQAAGCPLKLTGGYVDSARQDQLFQAEVKRLMTQQKFSQVLAENQAQSTVGRGGYSECQTGLAVTFSAEGLKSGVSFASTAQYRWLNQNSVNYGFVLRYPEDKSSSTGMAFDPSHYRYVGSENALKMREFSMCLEEYVTYLSQQAN